MKKIIFDQRKYDWNDFLRQTIILFTHLIGFGICLGIIFIFNFMLDRGLSISLFQWKLLLYYPLTFGILVNTIFQIIYSEIGGWFFRIALWFHAIFNVILIAVIIFVF